MALALITGSYGGLGTEFANIHAASGGDLILVGRSQDKLDAQKTQLEADYRIRVDTIAVDLSTEESSQFIYDSCKNLGLLPDYFINNAGFGGQGDFARERSMEQDMTMIKVNIESPTRLLKLFLPDMIERGSGRVLNVSSTPATMAGPLQAVYYASKAYVTSWSNALWREVQGSGMSVSCLMPGAMATGFAEAGGLDDTKLFANAVSPTKVAQEGYDGMLKGKINVISGLVAWQKPMVSLAPIMPRKSMLNFVYDQQVAGSAGK